MGRKRKKVSQQDILNAREIVDRFGDLSIRNAPLSDLRSMIKIFYEHIHGKLIDHLPEKQLYRVAEEIYNRSFRIVQEEDPVGKSIFENLRAMKRTSGTEREMLDERVCIQLEGNNIPGDSYLSREYFETKKVA